MITVQELLEEQKALREELTREQQFSAACLDRIDELFKIIGAPTYTQALEKLKAERTELQATKVELQIYQGLIERGPDEVVQYFAKTLAIVLDAMKKGNEK